MSIGLRDLPWLGVYHCQPLCLELIVEVNIPTFDARFKDSAEALIMAQVFWDVTMLLCELFLELQRIIVPSHSWLGHCTTNRKVAGLIPNGIIGIFH
jgi:hypothetical protein